MEEQLHRRTVVVGVDGSADALRAVRWGAAEAERWRVPLRLVTAFGLLMGRAYARPDDDERYRQAMLHRARRHLAEAVAEVARQERRIEVEQQILVGHPLSVLGAESRHAQLVVIGDRGRSRIDGLLAGSVGVRLRGRRGPARAAGCGPCLTETDAAARELLVDRLAGWVLKYPDVTVTQLVVGGSPARILVEQASRSQLLVVGSRGRGEFAGLLLGSVSHAVLHSATCPVAVIRPDPEVAGVGSPAGVR